MRRFASAALAAMFLVTGAYVFAADLKFPALTGRVVDDAGILSTSTKSELDAMLAQHERSTSEQVAVVTLDSLQGHSIEDYGYQLGRYWGIGQKGKNNGAILIVAPHERKTRIEVGYGLEGQLTDAISRVIIEEKILPQFRNGDFNAGVLDGTAAILRALGDDAAANLHSESEPVAQPAPQYDLGPFAAGLGLWVLFAMMMLFVLLRARRRPYLMRHGSGFSGWGGGGSSSDSGSSSDDSSDFSGGGGSFGGGGASGGW